MGGIPGEVSHVTLMRLCSPRTQQARGGWESVEEAPLAQIPRQPLDTLWATTPTSNRWLGRVGWGIALPSQMVVRQEGYEGRAFHGACSSPFVVEGRMGQSRGHRGVYAVR